MKVSMAKLMKDMQIASPPRNDDRLADEAVSR
jgi:hypothetical protein